MEEEKGRVYPERKCVACQGRFPKGELIRIVKANDGTLTLDKSGKADGRGAYLCKSARCLELAIKRGRLAASLKCRIPDGILEILRGYLT